MARDAARGLKLYVRRVFIMDDAEQFLPLYLRFIKGVIDSSDLPLNVSRELLQQDADVEAMKGGLTRRVLELLAKLASDEPAKYATFWKEFGAVLKEGLAEDYSNREKILPLLRFASTHEAEDAPTVSLKDYVGRMKSGQEKIYYVIADSVAAARSSPHIEQLKALGIEVLLMSERVDEWVMGQVEGFEGKSFKDAARGDLELGALASESGRAKAEEQLKEHQELLQARQGRPGRARGRGARGLAPDGLAVLPGDGRARPRRRHAPHAGGAGPEAARDQAGAGAECGPRHRAPPGRHDGRGGLRRTRAAAV